MKPATRQKRYQRSVLAVIAVAIAAAISLASCIEDHTGVVPELPANLAMLDAQ